MESWKSKVAASSRRVCPTIVIPHLDGFPKQFHHIQENPYPEVPERQGMGELVFNGASAAYVDAVERALNTRFTSIPIPPEAIESATKHVH